MGTRTIYFCDWCGVESPHKGHIPHDWKVHVPEFSSVREHLCVGCVEHVTKAASKAKEERQALRSAKDKENNQ